MPQRLIEMIGRRKIIAGVIEGGISIDIGPKAGHRLKQIARFILKQLMLKKVGRPGRCDIRVAVRADKALIQAAIADG